MSLKLGNSAINNIKQGLTQIKKIYQGTILKWQSGTVIFTDACDTLTFWLTSGAVFITSGAITVQGNFFNYANQFISPLNDHTVDNFDFDFKMKTDFLGDFFFLCGSSGNGNMFRLDTRGGSAWCGLAATSGWTGMSAPSSSTNKTANTWYNIKVSVVGSTASCYIDGVFVNSITVSRSGKYIGLVGDGGGGYSYFDDIVITKY